MERTLPALRIESTGLRWVALLLPVAVLAVLVGPMFGARFGFIDDHGIVAMNGQDGRVWPWEWPGVFASYDLVADGRFRPGWAFLQTTEAMLWGDVVPLWYASRLVLALVTAAAVMALAWPLPTLALAALAVMPFAGPQAEAWYRLGPQEAYAMPLLLGGLALLRWRRHWWTVALLLAAGLVKESFAVLLPIIVIGWWWIERRWSRPLIALSVGTAMICAVVAAVQLDGNFYGRERTIVSVAETGLMMVAVLTVSTAWLVPALATYRHPILLTALAVLASQAIVYGWFGSGIEGRYFAPAVVAVIVLATVGFRRIPMPSLVAVTMLLVMLPALWIQHQRAEHWAATSREFQVWVAEVDAYPGPLIIQDMPGNPEPAASVRRYLSSPRPAGPCAEVVMTEPTGRCATVFVLRGVP